MKKNNEPEWSHQLKQHCKDEASYQKMKELFEELQEKHDSVREQLNLLEEATKKDYDSILITELNIDEPGPRIVYVNDGFTKMTGYERDEVLGETPKILQGPKTDRHVLDRLKERLSKGRSFFGHTVNYKKDGSEFINQWDIHPLTNAEGDVTHWVSYQRDITDRKESSKLIFDTNIDFESLYKESKQIYVDMDVHGRIIDTNRAFRELIGFDEGELKEKRIWDLVSEDNKKEVEFLFSEFDPNCMDEDGYIWEFVTKKGMRNKLEANISYFLYNGETVVRTQLDSVSLQSKVIENLKKKKGHLHDILAKKDEFRLRFVKNDDGQIRCKYVSETFKQVTGLHPQVILDKGVEEVIHEDDIQKAEAALEEAFGGTPSTIKCKYKTSEGMFISVLQSFRPDVNGASNTVESVKSVVMTELPR